jgi:hypothetical protein
VVHSWRIIIKEITIAMAAFFIMIHDLPSIVKRAEQEKKRKTSSAISISAESLYDY